MKGIKNFCQNVRKQWMLWLMAAPALIVVFLFKYVPMAGLVMAFQRLNFKKGIFSSPFVGFDNFKFLFTTTDAWVITRNTILYNAAFIVLEMVLAVALAIIMSELTCKLYSKVLQTVFIMPHFLSMVVVATIVYAFLAPNGFINGFLTAGGSNPINFYSERGVWPFLLVLVYLWKHVGYSSIVYMAVISGISNEYYEAAALDGASKLQQIRYITIPHLRQIMIIKLIMAIGKIFHADFGLFYTVPRDSGSLYPVTNVLDTYIYRSLRELGDVGISTAVSCFQAVVGFVLVYVSNLVVRKIDSESSLF